MLQTEKYKTIELVTRYPLGVIYRVIPADLEDKDEEKIQERNLVKVFEPPVTLPEELYQDLFATLEEESLALHAILSERILPVLSVEKLPHSIIITMEYPDYPTLAHFVQQHAPLSLILVFSLVEQIRLIFAKFFELGIHRFQVEPDIILIKPKERHILYPDTGLINLAKYPELLRMGYLDGKPQFLPPELLRGGDLSAASEVYVFGVFTYYLFTGALPYADLPMTAAAALSIHEPLPPINRYKDVREKNLNTLIARATRKNPEERISSPLEFLRALRKICSPGGV